MTNDMISAVLVGALWGCTNPFLRKGSSESAKSTKPDAAVPAARRENINTGGNRPYLPDSEDNKLASVFMSSLRSLFKFRRILVMLPFILNQLGSVLFYKLLATSDLSNSVPICNALALVFSVGTAHILGERVTDLWRAILGSAFVTVGVSICVMSNEGALVDGFAKDEVAETNMQKEL